MQNNTITNSATTLPNIILSIIKIGDIQYIETKLTYLLNQVELNQVEIQIIRDINTQLSHNTLPTTNYLIEKFNYYFDKTLGNYLSKEAIDNAIIYIKDNQLKYKAARELINLGSELDTLTHDQIKDKLKSISDKVVIDKKVEAPENDFRQKDDAYADLISTKEGMSLVIPEVEQSAGKASKGSIISILAFTGSYKSTYALNIAYKNALDGFNILYLALEDTGIKIADRLVLNHIAMTAKTRNDLIESNWIRDNKLTLPQIDYYNRKHNELADLISDKLILWDTTKLAYQTFDEMTATLRLADKQFRDKTGRGLDAVIVDQISLLKYVRGSGRKASYDGAVINEWVTYFREQTLNFLDTGEQITTFIVSQVGREAYAEASKPKKKGRYDSSSASDSHEIERSSSTMITLYKDLDTRNTLLINVPKARNGYTPDNPIQTEVYGEYYHVGSLNIGNKISYDTINQPDFDLKSLLKGDS